MYKNFVAIDQYGHTEFVNAPRKDLTALNGVKHAEKMYRDVNGESKHVGYIVSSHWYEVMRLSPMSK